MVFFHKNLHPNIGLNLTNTFVCTPKFQFFKFFLPKKPIIRYAELITSVRCVQMHNEKFPIKELKMNILCSRRDPNISIRSKVQVSPSSSKFSSVCSSNSASQNSILSSFLPFYLTLSLSHYLHHMMWR
jgi:hypothetical protein